MDKDAAQLTTPSPDTRGKKTTRCVLYAFCAAMLALPFYFSFNVYRSMADLDVASPGGPYFEALGVRDGRITFTPAGTHTRGTITWAPGVEGKALSWHCSATGFRDGDLPSECRPQR
jgi:hypothetical protein